MAEKTEIEAEAAAQKAYAAAAEARVAPQAPATPTPAETSAVPAQAIAPEVVFPSKAKRKPKADAPAAMAEPAPAPAQTLGKTSAPPAALPNGSSLKTPSLSADTVRRTPAKTLAPAKKKTFKKAVPAKAVAQPLKSTVSAKAAKTKIVPQPKAAAPKIAAPKTVFQQLKDKTMQTTEFTTKLKGVVGEAQTKAKEAFGKGAATFGEYNEFSKGNLEAVVTSGKVLASGMQSLGTTLVADSKTAFETLTADVKELAAVKSPTDFFKLQAAFLRRNFETAVASTSKNSEAMVKLANEVAAPISARVTLAVDKVKQAA